MSPAIDFEVAGISCNSRDVKDNFVFVAIKGVKEDGATFIQEAIDRGAKAVVLKSCDRRTVGLPKNVAVIEVEDDRKAVATLADAFYGHPSSRMNVIGVTGTNGKTTITYLIESIVKELGDSCGVIGTINYRFKGEIQASKNTTPGPLQLQAMLAEMADAGVDYCAVEVSSHALDQDRTLQINFSAGLFTNLTQDHLDYHGDLETYFLAKAKLFTGLKPKSFAVVNTDDAYGRRLQKLSSARIVTYGIDRAAGIVARDITMDLAHTEFTMVSPGYSDRFKIRLIGRHNVYNVLAAYGWAKAQELDPQKIKKALEQFSFVPGRLEPVINDKGFSVFVDYAHTEDALKNVLNTLRSITRHRIIVVFGCGGDRDKTKRPKMGAAVTSLADFAIITSDNPRSEEPADIIRDITRGIVRDNFRIIPERLEAIRTSLSLAKSGDVILVAGKGHEDYQLVKDKILHFDDREAVKECLRSLN